MPSTSVLGAGYYSQEARNTVNHATNQCFWGEYYSQDVGNSKNSAIYQCVRSWILFTREIHKTMLPTSVLGAGYYSQEARNT